MLIELPELINRAQLDKLHEVLTDAEFVDGRLTAGKVAAQVKQNQELRAAADRQQLINRVLMSALGHNGTFRSFALPNRVADFIVARYQPGMRYGDHVDDPIMGAGGPRFRSDVSMTLFLNEPDQYEGGELQIRTPFGDKRIKLAAGSAVLYPSSSLHQVVPVSEGERLVALTWIQSFVRDAAQRELLFELDEAREQLLAERAESAVAQQVDRSYSNLLRMWADV